MKQIALISSLFISFALQAQMIINPKKAPVFTKKSEQFTGETAKVTMTVKPFDVKGFVQNKGQFNERNKSKTNATPAAITYGAVIDGMQVYFTKSGLTYRLEKFMHEDEEKEKEKMQKGDWKPEGEIELEKEFVHLQWIGANSNPQIVVENEITNKFNYADESTTGASTKYHNLPGYEKLTYLNLYPGIDVEYTFHPVSGIKYQLIVKPGANLSQVKMNYTSQTSISIDAAGNLHLGTDFGDFIDHAPAKTFYQNNPAQLIPCKFILNNNTVTFDAGQYDNTKTLIIDPWTQPPAGNNNRAYNALRDAAGNVYVHAGGGPFVIQKFSPAGVSLWTFNTTWSWYKGGFEVDNAGNSYSCDGFSTGARIKLNTAGAQQWNVSVGGFMEMWCLNFDCNKTRLYVLGHQGPSNTGQGQIGEINTATGAMIGTNLIYMNELHSSCIDQQGNIFSLTTGLLLQGPPPSRFTRINANMTPVYEILAGYTITELGPTYALGGVMAFNGLCADHCYVYTTDGIKMDKRCKLNGNIVQSVNAIPGGVFDSNAGICVDSCGNVYIGSSNAVHKYDNAFNLLSSAPTTGAVYDVKLGINGEIIACGVGFVSTINMNACTPVPCNQPPPSVTIVHTDAGCGTFGSATATMVGGCPPYTYSWSNGQTTQTATNLTAGTYTVYASDGGLCGGNTTIQDTVTILNIGGNNPTATSASTNNQCFGQSIGTATVNPSGGTPPYTYLWTPSAQTTQTATGLAAGSYTVVVTDASGCSVQVVINITEPPLLAINTSNVTGTTCGHNNGSAQSTANGGTPGYSYLWSNGATTQNVTGLAAGSYTVTVTDANGCTQNTTINIAPSQGPTVSFNINDSLGCAPVCVTFTLNSPSATTYTWSFGDNSIATTQNPVHCYTAPGSYQSSVTITDNLGCTAAYVYPNLINVYPFPQAAFTANPIVTDIYNSTITFTDLSVGAVSWTWSFADPLNSTSNQQNPSFTYQDSGIFCPILMVENQYTCRDTTTLCVEIRPEFTFYAPNAFTPNGDGKNDTWTPKGVGIDGSTFELFVFDRWGNLIWKTTQWQQAWDGKANGGKEIAQEDVYVWKCRFKDSVFGKKHEYIGHVSLIK